LVDDRGERELLLSQRIDLLVKFFVGHGFLFPGDCGLDSAAYTYSEKGSLNAPKWTVL
jgi:hypothetical protein